MPASDKLISLFEPRADIIVEAAVRFTAVLSSIGRIGRSDLILDLVIEAGTPADSERLLPTLARHRAKIRGVRDMAFHKRGGLNIEDLVRSRWVHLKLRSFSAGIGADIACLKWAYGLARGTRRGLGHFRAYVLVSGSRL